MAHRIPVGLVGVTGYTGIELARLLACHGGMELVRATSRSEAGKTLRDLFPSLSGFPIGELTISLPDPDDLAAACELVFLAVPHGTAMDMAAALVERGVKVVDLSADFRLHDAEVYAQWYGLEHRHPELLPEAVFGLPEFYADRVRTAQLVANPGCYPTSAILGLAPALRAGLVETDGIVIDSKSGTTGSGRKASVGSLFCEVSDTFRAYNLGRHRHTPEIEQELGAVCGQAGMTVSFNTHLLPINRGILTTAYARLQKTVSPQEAHLVYSEMYQNSPWVRVLPLGSLPETRFVRGTMFCDIGIVVDPRTNRLIVVSVIDNLCRGASGQALANANLMLGLAVDEGLKLAPLVP
ncbi:N-acetyl-gamma-glutamyl-phosphate reductase [Desulfobaculum xiamenense]|uniref:N-acetyl-gamma-glutamyl-phosphate reductase n=1 Tax=Desulfobaculum xiamenense TaxID=995050 RepID=A0A846QP48_9BACT|nr:N-acetyl-gamma-glutamyl-phosphate reductase [Desulfobaculum xiamenense]NJB68252.1 N-acetyl-gamma-glutamyl-phosphate reductase [Desulfobaculum xiamenense]